MFPQKKRKMIIRKKTKNKQSFDKKRAVSRLSAFVFGLLRAVTHAFIFGSGSLGLTLSLIHIYTLPGFLNQLLLLVGSGMVLTDALRRIADGYMALPPKEQNYFTESFTQLWQESARTCLLYTSRCV